jgi:hypothetical protein
LPPAVARSTVGRASRAKRARSNLSGHWSGAFELQRSVSMVRRFSGAPFLQIRAAAHRAPLVARLQ